MHASIRATAHVSLALSLAFAGAQAAAATAKPTYARDIAPLLNAHCVDCHRPKQIAPMSLLTYEETRPWAKSIRNMVSDKKMPPWYASHDSLAFKNNNTLSEEEIALFTSWVDGGAPRGDLADLPPAREFSDDGWTIGEPDAVFTMKTPFTLPDEEDDYQPEVLLEETLKEDTWITKVEVMPGNRQLVHHALVFIVPADGEGRGGRRGGGLTNGQLVGIYAPGTPPFEYAPGTGKKFPAGSKVQLQMHYHKTAGPGTAASDMTRVGMIFSDEDVADPVTTAWLANPTLNIPPNDPSAESTAHFTFKDDGQILSFMPHMHYRGKDMRYTATYPDGKEELLLNVPAYDFNWQLCYVLDAPKRIPKGTVVTVVAHHDNSADNPLNPDPSQNVTWGEETTDEMMIGFMDYTYDTLKDEQAIFPDGFNRGRGGDRGEGLLGFVFQFDKNKDDKIEREELPEHMREQFDRFDTNKDGFVDREELTKGGRELRGEAD